AAVVAPGAGLLRGLPSRARHQSRRAAEGRTGLRTGRLDPSSTRTLCSGGESLPPGHRIAAAIAGGVPQPVRVPARPVPDLARLGHAVSRHFPVAPGRGCLPQSSEPPPAIGPSLSREAHLPGSLGAALPQPRQPAGAGPRPDAAGPGTVPGERSTSPTACAGVSQKGCVPTDPGSTSIQIGPTVGAQGPARGGEGLPGGLREAGKPGGPSSARA